MKKAVLLLAVIASAQSNHPMSKADVDRDMKAAKTKLGPILDATDPDLRPFLKRGGKLILYHGWCDAAIPAENTINYYRGVEKKAGAKAARSGVRLFMAPGVQH